MRPEDRADEQGEVLHAVGVAILDPHELAELGWGDFPAFDGVGAVFREVLAGRGLVVEAVVEFGEAGGEGGVGEDEVEDYVVRAVGGWGVGAGGGSEA